MEKRDGALGLIAGIGALPEAIASAAKASGHALVCVQVSGSSSVLPAVADHYRRCAPGAWGEVLQTLRGFGVREVVIAGQFARADLFAGNDAVLSAFVAHATDRRDASLFEQGAAWLAELGIVLVEQTRFVGHLLVSPGVLTARAPSPEEAVDITFARKLARHMAELDVGQTVVVRRGAILAVEAAEGTDAAIRRGGALLPGAVVVKASRRNQDSRFDIPTVGPETIAAMRAVGARALGIDGRRTLVLDRERVVAEADTAGIAIVAADTPPLGTPVHAES